MQNLAKSSFPNPGFSMELGPDLYLRLTEVTLSVVLLMYQLGKELDIQDLATPNQMRIVSTSYTSMIIPLLFRLELYLFEKEDFSTFIDMLLVAFGITSYGFASFLSAYIFFSHSEDEWRSYDSEEKHFTTHVCVKALIALVLCIVLIVDFLITFQKRVAV